MANSNDQDRNLPASPRKIEKARAEGQVARSRDLGHFAALAAAGAVLVATAPALADYLRNALAQSLRFYRTTLAQPGSMGERLLEQTFALLWVVLPFGAVMVAAALAAMANRLALPPQLPALDVPPELDLHHKVVPA